MQRNHASFDCTFGSNTIPGCDLKHGPKEMAHGLRFFIHSCANLEVECECGDNELILSHQVWRGLARRAPRLLSEPPSSCSFSAVHGQVTEYVQTNTNAERYLHTHTCTQHRTNTLPKTKCVGKIVMHDNVCDALTLHQMPITKKTYKKQHT
jgi:hypothetical protein